jgi:hypothetical protein
MSILTLACPLMMIGLPGSAWLASKLGRSPASRAMRARCMSSIPRPLRGTTALPQTPGDGSATDA